MCAPELGNLQALTVEVSPYGSDEGVLRHFTDDHSGGVVAQELFQMRLECKSKDLPTKVEVDISELTVDGIIHVDDVPTLPGVTFRNPGNTPVVICHMPSGATEDEVEGEEAEGEEASQQEPEVIGRKAKEEESEEK